MDGAKSGYLNRNEVSPEVYFDQALTLFESLDAYHTDQISIANRRVHLKTPTTALRQKLLPALQHLMEQTEQGKPDLTIWYAADKDLTRPMKAPPWQGFNAQGMHPDLEQEDVQIFFQPWQTQLFLYSRSKSIGIYWTQSTEMVPWWEATFSFRAIFHLWTRDLPAQLVHAGAMAKNGTGVLIPGKSGSGKSTSCLNLLRAGYSYLGDDYVWLELGEHFTVFSLYQTAKIEPDNLQERFSEWIPFIDNKKEYAQQKAIFHVNEVVPGAGISFAVMKAILLPRVVNQEQTAFEKVSPSHALMAMVPTTLHHLPHNRMEAYQKLRQASAALPAYDWRLGRDLKQFIQCFDDLIKNELS